MLHSKTLRNSLFTVAVALLASGCNTVRHVDYQKDGQTNDPAEMVGLNRTVEVQVDPEIGRLTTDCVTVVPFVGRGDSPLPAGLERAIARHMRDRFGTVIGPGEAAALSRSLVVDLAHPSDRALYARETRCPLFVEISPWGTGSTYALVWTRRTVGAEVRLTDASGNTVYWRARHAAARADGGVPLSPVSALVNVFEAASLQQDGDLEASLVDDLARRLVATIPELGLPRARNRLVAGRRLDSR